MNQIAEAATSPVRRPARAYIDPSERHVEAHSVRAGVESENGCSPKLAIRECINWRMQLGAENPSAVSRVCR